MARPQFEGMSEAWLLGARVARPLFCDDADGIVATAWAGDESMIEALSKNATAREVQIVAAGEWLADWHRRGAVGLRAFAPELLTDPLADLRAAGTLGPNCAAALAALDRRASALTGAPCDEVRVFGDFAAKNLILNPQGPVAIDRPRRMRGPAARDHARFLLDLAINLARSELSVGARDARLA
ncbi:hypothetical protein E2L08_10770 [Palleronia sediminis]|uniref:Aminoglycoside phosphotransferase domain-containing protein n=1 Tax=Palleronia sediminis TaxID=2547833 RepID=A0A4R6AAW5_9RHOB|nr:hypothetical protein [Palleronia sediminis]TDL78416.1 hypothetical protein E2L08_10770 [Palleronia sediminis]